MYYFLPQEPGGGRKVKLKDSPEAYAMQRLIRQGEPPKQMMRCGGKFRPLGGDIWRYEPTDG